MKCSCGSYAINHHLHKRNGSDPHLCDVCYWRIRAERLLEAAQRLAAYDFGAEGWSDGAEGAALVMRAAIAKVTGASHD